MKHLIYFKDYLTESASNIDTIYDKYYSDISRSIFNEIIESDPTTALKDSKMGVYCKWLLKIYINKKLLLEDLYKATEYLTAFHQFKHKIQQKDINYYKSLPELFKAVVPFLEKEETKFENDEERKLAGQFKEVFRNDKYRIIIPKTLKASKYFGRGTEWCTTKSDNFEDYTRHQDISKISPFNLYILYTENLDDRLQFHFDAQQFMDINDEDIEMGTFWKENPDIKKLFKDVLRNIFYNRPYYEQMKACAKYLHYTYYVGYKELNELKNKMDIDIIELVFGSIPYDDTYVFGVLYLVDKKIDISEIQNVFKEKYDIYDISVFDDDFIFIDEKLEYDKSKKYILLMSMK